MKVECIEDRVNPKIHDDWLLRWANTDDQLELTIGKVYVVLAIAKYYDNYFFYVLGDESDTYPLAFPQQFFKIKDLSLSQYWYINKNIISTLDELNLLNEDVISFKEWAILKDKFYEKILEEDKEALSLFSSYKDKMLQE
jgi:hypothetical protein